MSSTVLMPVTLGLDGWLKDWLMEDIGRGDRTTQGLNLTSKQPIEGQWTAKAFGRVAGLPIANRVFQLLDANTELIPLLSEGEACRPGEPIAKLKGSLESLLMGERVALNLAMRLSGIATATREYVDRIADLSTQFVDTRKTTPGLRILEKYASQVGGAVNHRMGLDDAVMIKDNHIAVAGGIGEAIAQIRQRMPYPLTIEVETETLTQVQEALEHQADIIMLDNMSLELMTEAVQIIRQASHVVKIEASGNVNLETIRAIAQTGVDYISSSAPITRSSWLDLSMKLG
ncbi:carboxylating nicotinate-nucleotide diphosphorylase [Roseofilum sp. BLCC_M154]|uniref:nicotinate-nucleotide diphosphorylase (carboxylating) n=1 Tax=Roseofilum acuticapitatum BLCC-M154 TaxID=3022444 RepID=A0ABT7AP52_9CYAN|nr:carboxylating nicotinate-nucleotide diphosphorylase [Roseofilum acuticapitatum]MDJ1168650.1 carboxylating nicotinate-nucleotide diphosphorylase [Roseofilum acuticapitatum BLCC-M154]